MTTHWLTVASNLERAVAMKAARTIRDLGGRARIVRMHNLRELTFSNGFAGYMDWPLPPVAHDHRVKDWCKRAVRSKEKPLYALQEREWCTCFDD